MDITPLIMIDPYEDYFNKIMKLHCDAISKRNDIKLLTEAEIRFKIDTMDKIYLVIYLERLDSKGLVPFNEGEVPADFVSIEIDRLKVPSRRQLVMQLSNLYGVTQLRLDELSKTTGNPMHDLVLLIEREFMHKKYVPNLSSESTRRSMRIGVTPSNPDPIDYVGSRYYLSLYREDVYELYRRLKILVETLSSGGDRMGAGHSERND